MRRILIAVASAATLLAASCSDPATSLGAAGDQSGDTGDAQVADIRSIDDLRSAFNEDVGAVRMVLSMSPT